MPRYKKSRFTPCFCSNSFIKHDRIIQKEEENLRPTSLTPCTSKVAEEYTKPAVLENPDMNQYGAVPKLSTTLAFLVILYTWTKGTDEKVLLW